MQKLITVLRSNFDFMLFMIFLHLFIELYLLLQASRNENPSNRNQFSTTQPHIAQPLLWILSMMVILSSRVILVICIFTWFPLLYWKSSPSVGGTLFWLSALPTIAEAHWLITQSAWYWQLTAHLSIRSLKHKLIKPYSGLRKDGSEPRQILNRVRCSCIDRSYGTVSDDICRGNVCMRMLLMENEPPESLTQRMRSGEMLSDCFKI